MAELWEPTMIGEDSFYLMNLKHPRVENEVMAEMEAGVDVFYDRRWEATAILTDWFSNNLDLFRDKKILILGAGVGAETLILSKYAKHVWINDLAPTAIDLCAEQLEKNEFSNFTSLVGTYETLDLPKVDLVVASFLIYNEDTFIAMREFLSEHQGQVILMNEQLAPFPKFLELERHEIIFEIDGAVGVLL